MQYVKAYLVLALLLIGVHCEVTEVLYVLAVYRTWPTISPLPSPFLCRKRWGKLVSHEMYVLIVKISSDPYIHIYTVWTWFSWVTPKFRRSSCTHTCMDSTASQALQLQSMAAAVCVCVLLWVLKPQYGFLVSCTWVMSSRVSKRLRALRYQIYIIPACVLVSMCTHWLNSQCAYLHYHRGGVLNSSM